MASAQHRRCEEEKEEVLSDVRLVRVEAIRLEERLEQALTVKSCK
jgi:hypothetical protein